MQDEVGSDENESHFSEYYCDGAMLEEYYDNNENYSSKDVQQELANDDMDIEDTIAHLTGFESI